MTSNNLSLKDLLSTCYTLSSHACGIIRKVQAKRETEGAEALNATLKDENDSRTYLTEADTAAQELIWNGLRSVYGPHLSIVGEEDAVEEEANWSIKEDSIGAKVLNDYHIPEDIQQLAFSDVVVFVDPVDGTREFVEGRLSACQNLIGISYRGRALAGVVGLPFTRLTNDGSQISCGNTETKIIFGVVGSKDGVSGLPDTEESSLADESELVLGISADLGEKEPALKFVRETILSNSKSKTTRLLKAGACGNKCLKVIQGEADCALMNFGCSLWDTCATEALVLAGGGRVVTLFGWNIGYGRRDEEDKDSYKNIYGVFVVGKNFESKYGATVARFIQQNILPSKVITNILTKYGVIPSVPDQDEKIVTDLIRNIEGTVLITEYFNNVVGGDTINSYYSLEKDTVRYKQSHACRIIFDTGHSAFFKRIVLRELPSAVEKAKSLPYKLERDVKANMNENNFLKLTATEKFNLTEESNSSNECDGKAQIVRAYDCQARVYTDNPIDSKFTLLLEDFSEKNGWKQFPLLDENNMKSTLQALAKFHAFFWLKDKQGSDEVRTLLWEVATYWDLEKQPAGQIELLENSFKRLIRDFKIANSDVEEQNMFGKNYGLKLSEIAKELNDAVHNSPDKQTIIHGDPKSPNFFFKKVGDKTNVGMIDFQWTGAGLCATDVAYAIWTCPQLSVLEREDDLVQYYHAQLVKYLQELYPEQMVEAWLTKDQFLQEYKVCFLDLSRCILADQWLTASLECIHARKDKLVYNAYNKDQDIARLLLRRVMQCLDSM